MVKRTASPVMEVTAEPPVKVTGRWGTSEAKWFADREDESVTVHMRESITLTGYLVGVDNYNIFLEIDKKVVLVPKHAINYATD